MRYNASPFAGLPVVVKNLLIVNVIVFLIQLLWSSGGSRVVEDMFALHFFASPSFEPWQLVTHMFMHAVPGSGNEFWFFHIIFNMFGLYMFGPPLEYKWGSKRFFTFYMLSGIGAALFYSGVHALEYFQLMDHLGDTTVSTFRDHLADVGAMNMTWSEWNADTIKLYKLLAGDLVGASGALYGILLAFGLTFPNVELMIFPLPVPIKARYLVFILAGLSIFLALQDNPDDNVAHVAHLGGMVIGYLLMKLWERPGPIRPF
jgi:membrane associated rhomboid family serine protease